MPEFFRKAKGTISSPGLGCMRASTVQQEFTRAFGAKRWRVEATDSGLKLTPPFQEFLVDRALFYESSSPELVAYELRFTLLLRWVVLCGVLFVGLGATLLATGWGPPILRVLAICGGPANLIAAFGNRFLYELWLRRTARNALKRVSA